MSCVAKDLVAIVTLNCLECPGSLSRSIRDEFVAAMERAAKSAAVRAVVLAATGKPCSAETNLQEMKEDSDGYLPGVLVIAAIPKPVIAAVRGTIGVGLAYVLACDFVLIGKGSCMHVTLSDMTQAPSIGVGWQIARRLGHQRAFEIATDSQRLSAERCLQLGLANRIASEERVLEEAETWAAHFARVGPEAIAATKRILWGDLYQEIERSKRFHRTCSPDTRGTTSREIAASAPIR